jgi:acid phosphatase
MDPPSHQRLIPTLWVQNSVEWRAACLQSFRVARVQLDAALKDKSLAADPEQNKLPAKQYRKLRPAIVVDIDDTVLDNSPEQARQVKQARDYAEGPWGVWVLESKAPAIPGSVEFLKYAASRGVTIFYISNRLAIYEGATRKNLLDKGFPLEEGVDTVLLRGEKPGWEVPEKGIRRAEVAAKFRIVLMVGDDLGDFLPGVRVTTAQRDELVKPYAEWWGRRWIMVPNPSYGSWEEAIYGPPRPPEGAVRLERKMEALRTNGE